MEPQDSKPDTLAHIERVHDLLSECATEFYKRGMTHDASKLIEPEKSAFDRLKALSLSGMQYGSDEYRACLRAEAPAIQHHYQHNSHHPEFYPKRDGGEIVAMLRATVKEQNEQAELASLHTDEFEAASALKRLAAFLAKTADEQEAQINGMNLFDVMEMLMDWKAATERMKNGGDIRDSLRQNIDRFKLSPQLASILKNTIEYMRW